MATFEQAELLHEKTGVSFEDAKAALDASGGDMLDAVIWLERNGKAGSRRSTSYSTASPEGDKQDASSGAASSGTAQPQGETFGQVCGRFFRWLGRVIHKGNTNFLDVHSGGERIVTIPITALVILMIFAFWIIIPLTIVGLFCGCRFTFRGREVGKDSVNRVMDSAADAADKVKRDIKDGMSK